MQLSFTRLLDRNDVTLTVQASESLTGTWENLAQSVNGAVFTSLLSGVEISETGTGNARAVVVCDRYQMNDSAHPRRFLRLEVTP
jgi:5-carboxymethyl-2-hydroxymuconate isomerase